MSVYENVILEKILQLFKVGEPLYLFKVAQMLRFFSV